MASKDSGNSISQVPECEKCHALFKSLAHPGFENWVNASLCLLHFTKGVRTFTSDVSYELFNDLGETLKDCRSCPSCTTLPDFINNVVHKQCKTKECHELKDLITTYYQDQEKGSSFLKCIEINPKKAASLEVMKLFIRREFRDFKDLEEADCSALLAFFTSYISCIRRIDNFEVNTQNIRDTRNRIMHSPSLQLNEEKLQEYGSRCIKFLNDVVHEKSKQERDQYVEQIEKILSKKVKLDIKESSDEAIKQHFKHIEIDIREQRGFLSQHTCTDEEKRTAINNLSKIMDTLDNNRVQMCSFNMKDMVKKTYALENYARLEVDFIENACFAKKKQEIIIREEYWQDFVRESQCLKNLKISDNGSLNVTTDLVRLEMSDCHLSIGITGIEVSRNLKSLKLYDVTLPHDVWKGFLKNVYEMEQLEQLRMAFLKCSEHDRASTLTYDGNHEIGPYENHRNLNIVAIGCSTISDCIMCTMHHKPPICTPCYKISTRPRRRRSPSPPRSYEYSHYRR